MGESIKLQGAFTEVDSGALIDEEGISSQPLDPLALDIPDEDLARIASDWIEDSRSFYEEEYDLYERREKNEMYYFGRQILQKEKEKLLKDYESKYMDNVLYEIGATLKPLAMSRLPDLMVIPGNDSEEAVLLAQEVSKAVDTEIKDRNNRKVLGLAFKHLPVYFTAVIKTRWVPEIDDYIFEVVHPDLIDVDHTCVTNDADQMKFVSQIVPITVQEVILQFPKRKTEFLEQLKKDGLKFDQEPSYSQLGTTINIREMWFDEYKRHTDTETEKISGLLWKYKDVVLGSMKNPNFDYRGEKRYFIYDPEIKDKRTPNMDELNMMLLTGQMPPNMQEEQVYHNYFKRPRKPYYFFGYDQWGKQPYDETSHIEQNLQNQESLDKRGKQLEETLDGRGHNIFSKMAGLSPAEIEEMDMNDPDQDLVVDGDVNNTHKFIPPDRPTPQEFEEMNNTRNRMYAIAGSTATRGQIQSPVATTNQIAREADFTRADDLVEDTINDAAQWMADWAMQFIKLRYTKDHFRDIMGIAGDAVFIKLNRNMIADGMLVKIKASGTDKLRAQNNAIEMAKMRMTDPYTFYVDMGLSDPEGRTEKLILMKDPQAYLQKVIKGVDTSEALARMLMNQSQREADQRAQQTQPGMQPPPNPMQPGGQPMTPEVGVPPQNPSPENTSQVPIAPPQGAPEGSPRNL